jgi:O-methyltransferase domain
MPVFAYFEKDRKSAETFNRAMTSFSTVEAPTIAKAYDFSGIRSLTDIGGGHGLFLATILESYPDMTGTLFELPQVVHSLAGGPLERFKNRVRVLAGDMFRSVPAGADAYMIGLTSNAGRSCHYVARASPTTESYSSSTALCQLTRNTILRKSWTW